MNIIVDSCRKCPLKRWDLYLTCNHPNKHRETILELDLIHPSCPEGGAFEIKTEPIKIKEDEN